MTLKNQGETLFPHPDQIPEIVTSGLPCRLNTYLVNGRLKTWDGPFRQVASPVMTGPDVTARSLGEYPLLGEDQALEALEAAAGAYDHGRGAWPTMTVARRIDHLEQFIFGMMGVRDQVVNLLMWEVAKSRQDSLKEFDRTVQYMRDTIAALKDLDRTCSRFSIEEGIIGQTRRGPLGVVLCLGPFNYPLNETFTTLIPALVMGNTVVLKPPKHGALLYAPLLEPLARAFPPGTVNVIFGEGRQLIPPIMASGTVNVLGLIGTSTTANALKKAHPSPNRLRCVLGLEAKNPAIILEDADLDLAVGECLLGSLSYNGQRCTALKILFVHEAVCETFVRKFSQGVNRLTVGVPWQEGVTITPVAETGKTAYLQGLVTDALDCGAAVANPGGGRVAGNYFFPAVVYPASPGMRVYQEEQFGPVVPVVPFRDIREPVDYIIHSPYGQQASIFGQDPDRMAPLIDHLVNQVCRVNLNCQCQRGPDTFPFTGRKDSAEGTLSVADALRAFSIRTLVAAKQTDANRQLITGIVQNRKSRFLATDFIL